MKINTIHVWCCSLGLLAASAHAVPDMAPGLWEITMKMEMPGMPMAMPPTTIRHCYTKEAIRDSKNMVPADQKCKMDEHSESGNTVRWKVSCNTPKGAMTGTGEMTFGGQTYSGVMTMNGKVDGRPMNMKQNYSGKRVGECTK